MATVLIGLAINTGLYFLSRALAPDTNNEGPRLKEAQITSSAEGVSIPRLYGRMRLGGNLIWASKFKEKKVVTNQSSGGKGGGPSVTNTTYTYSCSFAIAFGEGGNGVQLGRVWADGKILDLSKSTVRFYKGTQTQTADSIMQTIEGTANVPAYRGITYLVFDNFQLADYGNRLPQITAEIIKPLSSVSADDLESLLKSVCMIPASGEFVYGTQSYLRDDGRGGVTSENVHTSQGIADALVSLNNLRDSAANVGSVLLVVSWFASDLRAGNCTVKPKVEYAIRSSYVTPTASYVHYIDAKNAGLIKITNTLANVAKVDIRLGDFSGTTLKSYTIPASGEIFHRFTQNAAVAIVGVLAAGGAVDNAIRTTIVMFYNATTFPGDWKVSGIQRELSVEVPRLPSGALVYGGTPADITVKQMIQDIHGRGWRVVFYPFILMDQIAGNALPDPYGGSEQGALPWRGRITCHPGIGQPGTVDKTAAAATQINSFFGSAAVANVPAGTDGLPDWTGSPTEYGYRRMVLHYARLCQMAGGVEAFLIGTELRGITQVRSSASVFPAIAQLKTLAADVRSIVGAGTKISYASDWSEYHSYRPSDGTNDVYFNMDDLWSDINIDFIGVDNYFPIADWRDGTSHLDYNPGLGYNSIYSLPYLKSNIEGGELHAWYYTNQAARDSQTRTNITDGAYSKPWVFRQKDIRNWWLNQHKSRPAGVESGSFSPWVAQSKPIWFTEFGASATNKSPNLPNVFYDLKSAESSLPYYSNGKRDDLVQRRYLEATLQYWRDNSPTSTVYLDKMIKTDNMFVWTWDARPYPEYPFRSDIWSDADNWKYGHWLTGRLGVVPLALLVQEICRLSGLTDTDVDVSGLYGSSALVRGYVIDKLMSPRDMLEPLMGAHNFDGNESEGKIKFTLKSLPTTVNVTTNSLVTSESDPGGYSLTRTQETELPASMKVSFYDEAREYDQTAVDGKKLTGNSLNVSSASFPMVLTVEYARQLADILLFEAWMGRDRAELTLPPSLMKLDPGDVVSISIKNRLFNLRISNIESGLFRKIEAAQFDVSIYDDLTYVGGKGTTGNVQIVGRSIVEFLDIPMLTGSESVPFAPRVAAYQKPWPGGVNVFEPDGSGGYRLNTQANTPAAIGELAASLNSGPTDVFDTTNTLLIDIYGDEQLLSTTENGLLAGENALAIRNQDGGWEIVQFQNANLTSPKRYQLTKLLRGQLGTEVEIRNPTPAGSRVVLLDQTILSILDIAVVELNSPFITRYGPGSIPVADIRYTDETRTFKGVGLQPYAPVQLSGARVSGNFVMNWIRRTRFNGDSWDVPEVPLNEETEAYQVDIMSGATIKRTLSVTTATATYLSADEITDFGSTQSTITFCVYQMSTTIGRGRKAELTANA
jgi:GTA TIM-barrel-like domain/Putative phage tail protein